MLATIKNILYVLDRLGTFCLGICLGIMFQANSLIGGICAYICSVYMLFSFWKDYKSGKDRKPLGWPLTDAVLMFFLWKCFDEECDKILVIVCMSALMVDIVYWIFFTLTKEDVRH